MKQLRLRTEAAGTPAALISALRAHQMACAGPDGVADRLDVAERMLTLAAERANPWAALWDRLWPRSAGAGVPAGMVMVMAGHHFVRLAT